MAKYTLTPEARIVHEDAVRDAVEAVNLSDHRAVVAALEKLTGSHCRLADLAQDLSSKAERCYMRQASVLTAAVLLGSVALAVSAVLPLF